MFVTNNKKKYLLICLTFAVIVVCVVGVVLLLYKPVDIIEPRVEDEVSAPIVDNKQTETPVIEEKQEYATSIIKAKVISIIDNTSTVLYKVSVGYNENAVESTIVANNNTIVYDAAIDRIVGVNALKEDMEIQFYGTGNYKVGNLVASAIVIGGDNSMKYGTLKEIYIENEGLYVGKILDTTNYINITNNTTIINGYTGIVISDLNTIKPNSMIFYYVESEFEQNSEGLFYDTIKIVVVRDGMN